MFKKIVDPLKLFVIGVIVAALIVLGFQLGKETDKGLLNYLEQENAALEAELEKLQKENSALRAESLRMQQEATPAEQTEVSQPANPASPQPAPRNEAAASEPPAASAPVIDQIVDTFSPSNDETPADESAATTVEESQAIEPPAETQQ